MRFIYFAAMLAMVAEPSCLYGRVTKVRVGVPFLGINVFNGEIEGFTASEINLSNQMDWWVVEVGMVPATAIPGVGVVGHGHYVSIGAALDAISEIQCRAGSALQIGMRTGYRFTTRVRSDEGSLASELSHSLTIGGIAEYVYWHSKALGFVASISIEFLKPVATERTGHWESHWRIDESKDLVFGFLIGAQTGVSF